MSELSPESTDQLIVNGARKLASEMLRKAISDYQMLESRGWVAGGVINRDILPIRHNSKKRRIVCGYMSVYDVFDLIDLFWSEELRIMCSITQLNISPNTVRALLKLPDKQPVFDGLQEIRDARQSSRKISR